MWLVLISRPAYFWAPNSNAAIDVLMGLAAFEQAPVTVLAGAGITLIDSSICPPPNVIDIRKHLLALPLYGINRVYTLSGRNGNCFSLGNSELMICPINHNKLYDLIRSTRQVLNF